VRSKISLDTEYLLVLNNLEIFAILIQSKIFLV